MKILHMPKTRIGAFFAHVSISTLILFILSYIIYFIWFPGALTFASGGLDGMKIVVAVDMVLGPLLTLVIYNVNKSYRELAIDVSVIAIIQISCLAVGMSMVYQQRPLSIVFTDNVFHVFDSHELHSNNIDLLYLEKFKGNYPKILIEKPPVDTAKNVQSVVDKLFIAPNAVNTDYWHDAPKDTRELEKLLGISDSNSKSSCIDKTILIHGRSGIICFNPETFEFSDYRDM